MKYFCHEIVKLFIWHENLHYVSELFESKYRATGDHREGRGGSRKSPQARGRGVISMTKVSLIISHPSRMAFYPLGPGDIDHERG